MFPEDSVEAATIGKANRLALSTWQWRLWIRKHMPREDFLQQVFLEISKDHGDCSWVKDYATDNLWLRKSVFLVVERIRGRLRTRIDNWKRLIDTVSAEFDLRNRA